MALSEETKASLQSAKEAIEEWHDKKVESIEDTAEFLRSVETPTETASSPVVEDATEEAQTLIDSILSS